MRRRPRAAAAARRRRIFVPYGGSWGSAAQWRRIFRRRFWRRLFRRRRLVGRRRRVGELVMAFSKEDHAAVAAAIRAAEQRTSGTDRVRAGARVFGLRACSDPVGERAGALDAMAAHLFHAMERAADFSDAACGLHRRRAWFLSWTPLRLVLVPRAVQRARAHRAALEQFVVRRVAHTKNRTGVLIFVSLAERYARIIADEGIAQKVHAAEWQAAIDALTGHMRDGRIAAGFTPRSSAAAPVRRRTPRPTARPTNCRIGST
jgi:putative membrane protein